MSALLLVVAGALLGWVIGAAVEERSLWTLIPAIGAWVFVFAAVVTL